MENYLRYFNYILFINIPSGYKHQHFSINNFHHTELHSSWLQCVTDLTPYFGRKSVQPPNTPSDMAHITIMSGSTSLNNKHLRPDYGKRDSNSASCQNIDRAGIDGQSPLGDPESLNTEQSCFQKHKTKLYFGCIGIVVILTIVLVVLALTGALDTNSS